MKFVLFVEGHTEKKALPDFLKRWLDPNLEALKPPINRVGIQIVRFDGWPELLEDLPKKVPLHLKKPDVIAVVALLDLYGPTIYPEHLKTAQERRDWAKKKYEKEIGSARFCLHFAVHETEAWILSQPEILPEKVQRALPGTAKKPETVNFNEPPAKLLERLYKDKLKQPYRKVIDGKDLFDNLTPDVVYQKCPWFQEMMNDLLERARSTA